MAPELFAYVAKHGKTISIVASKQEQVEKAVEESRRKMKKAAAELDYAAAAKYRDEMWALEQYLKVWKV